MRCDTVYGKVTHVGTLGELRRPELAHDLVLRPVRVLADGNLRKQQQGYRIEEKNVEIF